VATDGVREARRVAAARTSLFPRWLIEQIRHVSGLWFGVGKVMTIYRELQRSQRSRSFTLASGKPSPRFFRSFSSDNRWLGVECSEEGTRMLGA
jgi:hypothetical protein